MPELWMSGLRHRSARRLAKPRPDAPEYPMPGLTVYASLLTALAAPQADLAVELDRILASSTLRGASVGVYIKEIGGGDVLVRSADRRLVPASVMKLATAAAAWKLLGPDFSPATYAWRDSEGVKLLGGGDPGLTVDELDALGYRMQVQPGEEVLFDDSLFGAQRHCAGWDVGDRVYGYCAPVSGLTVNSGRVELWADAGRAWLEPRNFGISVQGAPGNGGGGTTFTRSADGWTVRVRGSANSLRRVTGLSLPDPAHCAARVFHPRARRTSGLNPPEDAEELQVRTLRDLIPMMLIPSDNHYAETLFRHCGVRGGESGSWTHSAAVVSKALADIGVHPNWFRVADGSGLSRSNQLTARAAVQILEWLLAQDEADDLLHAMATPGNGTLRTRLLDQTGVWAKTGTLTGACGLAGVVDGASGKRYVFAMLMNGYSGSANGPRAVQDAVVSRLARE